MKKVLICLAAMLVLLTGTVAAAPAGEAVGTLDIKTIMAESPKIKALQVRLDDKYMELSKQLEAEKSKLAPEQYKHKQDEAFKALLQTKLNIDVQIEELIMQAASEVAREKQLSLVVHKGRIAYGGIDITKDVLTKM